MENSDSLPAPLDKITSRLAQNLARVARIASAHQLYFDLAEHLEMQEPDTSDILRSAVVLLHASLEDFLRSVAAKYIPRQDTEFIGRLPLIGKPRSAKYSLADLVPHKDKTISKLIDESIDQWLNQHSFNNNQDIISLLKEIGLQPECCSEFYPLLSKMIDRRHRIVHNADRLPSNGELGEISAGDVQEWSKNVEGFMSRVVFKLLPDRQRVEG